MKKIKKEIAIIIILFIIISSIILIKPINDLDELWNYNFAKNICEGNMPYKDFNIIMTPLLPNICAFFLLVFGNELITMRILAIILSVAILFIIYKILDYLKVNKWLNYSFILFLIYIFYEHFRIDYNFLVLLNIFIIIYIELKSINITKNKNIVNIILGILAGLCICTKQTTGMVTAIVLVGYKIINIKNITDVKIFFKEALFRVIGIIIPIIILFFYFTINNLWADFINYAILGIKTFSNTITYVNLIKNGNIILKVLSIIVPLIIFATIVLIIKNRKKDETIYKNITIMCAYGIASMIVIFPISDSIHFLIGALPTMVIGIYLIDFIKIKKLEEKQLILQTIIMIIVFIISTVSISSIVLLGEYAKQFKNCSELKHFKGIPDYENQTLDIKQIDEFIENQTKSVYILDASAAVYTIPLDQYNKNYDMFLKGNLGADGEQGIIDKLNNEDNIIILIKNANYGRNWQNPEEVRKYIINNLEKIGEIQCYDIYEK